jgi:hypothetical protein
MIGCCGATRCARAVNDGKLEEDFLPRQSVRKNKKKTHEQAAMEVNSSKFSLPPGNGRFTSRVRTRLGELKGGGVRRVGGGQSVSMFAFSFRLSSRLDRPIR